MAQLVVLAGLPASGKSTIARELAMQIEAVWLRVDSMDQAIWDSGTAPADLRDWTYRAAQAIASDNLSLGLDVIADCVNGWPAARNGWEQAARRAGADVIWLEIVCSDAAEHRRRVETRSSDIPGLRLPNWEVIASYDYAPSERDHVRIDTASMTITECVQAAAAALMKVR